MAYEYPFSEDMRDQRASEEANGKITIKGNGKVVFQFPSQEDYKNFLEIRRKKHEKHATDAVKTYKF